MTNPMEESIAAARAELAKVWRPLDERFGGQGEVVSVDKKMAKVVPPVPPDPAPGRMWRTVNLFRRKTGHKISVIAQGPLPSHTTRSFKKPHELPPCPDPRGHQMQSNGKSKVGTLREKCSRCGKSRNKQA